MKKLFPILAIAAILSATIACNPKDLPVQEDSFDFNIETFVSQNFFAMSPEGGKIDLAPKAPFDVVVGSTNSSIGINKCVLNVGGADDYTEEIFAYIKYNEVNRAIKGFGYFNYPIVIRLEGEEGTSYLDKDELTAMKQKSVDWGGDAYIKGTVKSVSNVYDWAGILRHPSGSVDYYDFPICGNRFGGNVMSIDQTKPYDLEAVDIVVESEGVQISVRAAWVKAYKLLGKMNLKAGDEVEIYADKRGIDGGHDKDILVNPLSVVVKK